MSSQKGNELTEPSLKVLIADNDPSILRALSARCSKLGLEVQTAENGLQAIVRASRDPPRLVIVDVDLPEVDGWRVCEWLLDPKRPPANVVVLTGRDDIATLDRCDSLGAYYVPKGPDAWDMLFAIFSEVLPIEGKDIQALASIKVDKAEPLLTETEHNKVLIVDDDEDLAKSLAHRLQKCGAITSTAPDGIRGYRKAVKERPDVIITDYNMPRGSGHYMIWRLKSTETTRRIPIIAMSGERRDPRESAPLDQETEGYGGPAKFFPKPLDVDALFKEVGRYCKIHYTPFQAPL